METAGGEGGYREYPPFRGRGSGPAAIDARILEKLIPLCQGARWQVLPPASSLVQKRRLDGNRAVTGSRRRARARRWMQFPSTPPESICLGPTPRPRKRSVPPMLSCTVRTSRDAQINPTPSPRELEILYMLSLGARSWRTSPRSSTCARELSPHGCIVCGCGMNARAIWCWWRWRFENTGSNSRVQSFDVHACGRARRSRRRKIRVHRRRHRPRENSSRWPRGLRDAKPKTRVPSLFSYGFQKPMSKIQGREKWDEGQTFSP